MASAILVIQPTLSPLTLTNNFANIEDMLVLPHIRRKLHHDLLEENLVYHVFNRSNNREVIFPTSANYLYFMTKFQQYLGHCTDLYAYCILPNHFHLLIEVKSMDTILNKLKKFKKENQPLSKAETDFITFPHSDKIPQLLADQFRRLFIGYAQMFNKMYGRYGSVFQKPFKRLLVVNPEYLNYLLYYIHTNPQKHGLVDDFREWAWNSYHAYEGYTQPWLNTHEPTNWFDNREALLAYHQQGPYGANIIPESWLEGDTDQPATSNIPVLD